MSMQGVEIAILALDRGNFLINAASLRNLEH